MLLNEPSVGTTPGPTWATEVNENFTSIDQHDHTSGKGVQLTPSALDINSDLEFNGNAAIELKRLTFDSSVTGSGTNYSVYQLEGNLFWYNGSGQSVQITNGANVKTTGGSIDGMESTYAGADYGSGYFKWEFDTRKTPFAGAKMKNADIELHKYDGASGSNAYVILKYTGSSEGSNNITVPDETGTMVTSNSTVPELSIISVTASKPDVVFANNTNDSTAPTISLKNLRNSNNGVNGDDAGTINFFANDSSANNQIFSQIHAEISDATSGGEEGKFVISVAESDGTVSPGLILTGTSADGVVNATIGLGATSTTTISGNLDILDGTIVNVGDLDCDSISVADAANGLNINFNGNTGTNKLSLTDNLASALDITESSNSYIKFVTTDSSEQIVFGKNSTFSGTTIADIGTVLGGVIQGSTIGVLSHTTGKFTTCEATTNFTIANTVLTDRKITATGTFEFDLEGDLSIDVNGGNVTYSDNGTAFLGISYSGGNTTITGP